MKEVVYQAIRFANERMKNNYNGHDFYHAERVYKKAIHIADKEGCNTFICGLAAILHDIDSKWVLNLEEDTDDCTIAREFLQKMALDIKEIDLVCDIINFVAERPNARHMAKKIEALCVYDANALDGIGAIGIARAFNWGSNNKQVLYNGDVNDDNTIKHFYDALLPKANKMLTTTGKELAVEKKEFMERFLQQFYYEWSL